MNSRQIESMKLYADIDTLSITSFLRVAEESKNIEKVQQEVNEELNTIRSLHDLNISRDYKYSTNI